MLDAKQVKTNITQNQYGTHPAFQSVEDAIIWILQNGGAVSGGGAATDPVTYMLSGYVDPNYVQ